MGSCFIYIPELVSVYASCAVLVPGTVEIRHPDNGASAHLCNNLAGIPQYIPLFLAAGAEPIV